MPDLPIDARPMPDNKPYASRAEVQSAITAWYQSLQTRHRPPAEYRAGAFARCGHHAITSINPVRQGRFAHHPNQRIMGRHAKEYSPGDNLHATAEVASHHAKIGQ